MDTVRVVVADDNIQLRDMDDKPTNGEFIALVADRLSVDRTA